ncbi:MAG: hypothetical protein IJW55_00230 [Clostridia bacterium]|nr:hypothetical protein [Clostridia bacterium]
MKKFLSVLLTLAMLVTLAVPVMADDVNAGYSATNITSVELTSIPDIKTLASTDAIGFSVDAYANGTAWKITDAEGLVLFSKITNCGEANTKDTKTFLYSFYQKTVYLANDIDMTGVTDFEPIGNDGSGLSDVNALKAVFCGTFDGQGHSIKNLVMESDAQGFVKVALFGALRGAIIRNVVIDETCSFTHKGGNAYATTAALVGAIVSHGGYGDTYAHIDTGTCTVLIENCANYADVNGGSGYTGGIVATAFAATGYIPVISHCTNAGTVSSVSNAGGIMGTLISRWVNIEYCVNSGNVIAGNIAAGIIPNIDWTQDTVGNRVYVCNNSGLIVAGNVAAGIIGNYNRDKQTITNCANTGNYQSAAGIGGGIYGQLGESANVADNVTGNTDTGTMVALGGYVAPTATEDLTEVADINTLANTSELGFDADAYTAGTSWKITDANGLKLFSTIVNTANTYDFFEKTVYLANDIDMTGVTDFKPIADDTTNQVPQSADHRYFRGTFDGQGYAIKNLVMTSDADGYANVALFGVIRGAIIKNVVIDASCSFTYTGSSANARTASLVAYAFSHGSDNLGTSEVTEKVVTYIIENVKNAAPIDGGKGNAGGIVATAGGGTGYVPFVKNCTNLGTVTCEGTAGGIVGALVARHVYVDNCVNAGNVKGVTASGILSNVVSESGKKSYVNACTVLSAVSAGTNAGGISYSAVLANTDITECTDYSSYLLVPAEEVVIDYGFGTEEITYEGTVGYSADRVVTKDLTNVIPICAMIRAIEYEDVDLSELKISTPADLVMFATLVNSGATFSGTTIYLENDLNMEGYTMMPIGTNPNGIVSAIGSCNNFAGTFDGQGHVIDNLVMTSSEAGAASSDITTVALFGMIRSATLKNIVLGSGCRFTYTGEGSSYTAGIVAIVYRAGTTDESRSIIDNCYSAATVGGAGNNSSGGIAAIIEGNNNNFSHYLYNCTNAGKVSSDIYAGGIVAYINNRRIDIINCRNTGDVTCLATEPSGSKGAGGIVARPNSAQKVTIKDCINNGAIKGPGNVGGIVAIENQTTVAINRCSNYGTLTLTAASANYKSGPICGSYVVLTYDHMSENVDATGKTDATLPTYTFTTNFPNYAEIDAAHDLLYPEITAPDPGPGEENTTPETEPVTEPTTEAPTGTSTTEAPTDDDSGCASVVGGMTVIMLTAGAAMMLAKKKKEDEI